MERVMTDTTPEYIAKVIAAAPFADNEAGIPQMVALIKALATDATAALEREAKLKQIADEVAEAAWGHDEAFCIIEDSAQEAARSNLEAKLMAYREFRAALGVQP
jgi:hypothetical protein